MKQYTFRVTVGCRTFSHSVWAASADLAYAEAGLDFPQADNIE